VPIRRALDYSRARVLAGRVRVADLQMIGKGASAISRRRGSLVVCRCMAVRWRPGRWVEVRRALGGQGSPNVEPRPPPTLGGVDLSNSSSSSSSSRIFRAEALSSPGSIKRAPDPTTWALDCGGAVLVPKQPRPGSILSDPASPLESSGLRRHGQDGGQAGPRWPGIRPLVVRGSSIPIPLPPVGTNKTVM
jgi:hypothetical protein